jgi:hypothetical protein
MLSGIQAGLGLRGVHLGRRAQDHRIDFLQRQRIVQIGRRMSDVVLGRDFLGLFDVAADQRNDFHPFDVLDAIQVLDAKSAGASQRDLDRLAH